MRDGVHLATDVYLPGGPGPFPAVLVRLPYDKNGRYCWMPFIATHVVARGYAFVPAGRARQIPLRGRAARVRQRGRRRLRHDRLDRAAAVVERRRRHVGRQLLRLHAMGGRRVRHPALKAIVPRVTIADIDGWLEGVTPLYGAHYLGEYWTDHDSHEWSRRLEPPAAGGGVRRRVSRRSARRSRLVRLRARALARRRARAALPRRAPVRRAAHPDAARRRLVRQHHAAPHARLRGARREPRDGAVPVPARRIDRPRELPASSTCRSRQSDDHAAARRRARAHAASATSGRRSTSSTPS